MTLFKYRRSLGLRRIRIALEIYRLSTCGFNALSVYAATRASLVGFTRLLAREVGRIGVTVNAIAPGFVDTELTKGLGDEGRERVAARSALRRLADPRDVAAMAAF